MDIKTFNKCVKHARSIGFRVSLVVNQSPNCLAQCNPKPKMFNNIMIPFDVTFGTYESNPNSPDIIIDCGIRELQFPIKPDTFLKMSTNDFKNILSHIRVLRSDEQQLMKRLNEYDANASAYINTVIKAKG